jgi:hypothetical protein
MLCKYRCGAAAESGPDKNTKKRAKVDALNVIRSSTLQGIHGKRPWRDAD